MFLFVLSFIVRIVGLILTEYVTGKLEEDKEDISHLIPTIGLYIIFIFQMFGSKVVIATVYFIILILAESKKRKWYMTILILIYGIAEALQLILIGPLYQVLFPFEIITNILGIHNSRLKMVLN